MSPVINKKQGFTLVETVSTLAIVVILLGFILPSVFEGMAKYRVLASAQEIGSQVQSARYRSLRNNTMCSFIISASGRQFGIDADGDGSLTSGTQDIVLSLQNSVNFSNLATPPISGATSISTGTKSGVGFTPRGTLTTVNSSTGLPDFATAFPASGIVIYLSGAGNEFAAVTVSAAGRVKTWRSVNGSTWQQS